MKNKAYGYDARLVRRRLETGKLSRYSFDEL